MKQNGFTLIEMLVVITIAGILLAMATLNFGNWTSKSNIEAQIRELYADLSNTQVRAMSTNRLHFVDFSGAQYSITEDTDGDGTKDSPPADTMVLQKTMKNAIVVSGGPLLFDSRGIAPNNTTLSLVNTSGAVFDCILISQTVVNMGLMNGGSCVKR